MALYVITFTKEKQESNSLTEIYKCTTFKLKIHINKKKNVLKLIDHLM